MTLQTEGRRFLRELRRNRRARLLAHQTIVHVNWGWWGWWGWIDDCPGMDKAVTGRTRRDVEQQIDRYHAAAITARVLRRYPAVTPDHGTK